MTVTFFKFYVKTVQVSYVVVFICICGNFVVIFQEKKTFKRERLALSKHIARQVSCFVVLLRYDAPR